MAAGVVCPGDVLCAVVRRLTETPGRLRHACLLPSPAPHQRQWACVWYCRRTLRLGPEPTLQAQTSAPLSSARTGRWQQTQAPKLRCSCTTLPHTAANEVLVMRLLIDCSCLDFCIIRNTPATEAGDQGRAAGAAAEHAEARRRRHSPGKACAAYHFCLDVGTICVWCDM